MIIDCHYHLELRIQPLENLTLKMDRYGIDKVALMPSMCDPIPHPPEFQLKAMRFFLTHSSVRGLAKKLLTRYTPEGDIILPKGPVRIYKDPDNKPVAEILSAYPDRFLGWIFVNPRGQNDPIDEYEKWKKKESFIGIKAHPFWHRYPPTELMPIAEKASAAGMPLLIHAGFDDHGDFLPLINELPKLKLILAHTGYPRYGDTWKIIKTHPNVYIDLSADAYVDVKTTRCAVDFLGVERCLFGTDGPYGSSEADNLFNNGFIKQRLETLFPDKGVQKRLLGDNFSELIS